MDSVPWKLLIKYFGLCNRQRNKNKERHKKYTNPVYWPPGLKEWTKRQRFLCHWSIPPIKLTRREIKVFFLLFCRTLPRQRRHFWCVITWPYRSKNGSFSITKPVLFQGLIFQKKSHQELNTWPWLSNMCCWRLSIDPLQQHVLLRNK